MARADAIWEVVVIGGGASGMMAAGRAAELLRERGEKGRVLLLEKNARLGEKLLITGGGRSNVTNYELDDRKLLAKFKDRADFLFSPFSKFSVKETLDFFAKMGMETTLEAEGRMFPKSGKAESVWRALVSYLREGGVVVRSNANVASLARSGERIRAAKLEDGEEIRARSFILATGGSSRPETGSTGDGWKWLAKLGHAVRLPTAALTPVRTREAWSHSLTGLSFQNARATLSAGGKTHVRADGKILFTHQGLSGPLILNMSRAIGELLEYGECSLSIDLFPKRDPGTLDRELLDFWKTRQNKKLVNALGEFVPLALSKAMVKELCLDGELEVNKVSKAERKRIVAFMKAIPITPTGLLGMSKAVIASGGLDLTEVDLRHMRSKRYPNLYVVGDILDIDRPSGGYSLQLCWTTGWVAGTGAATEGGPAGRSAR